MYLYRQYLLCSTHLDPPLPPLPPSLLISSGFALYVHTNNKQMNIKILLREQKTERKRYAEWVYARCIVFQKVNNNTIHGIVRRKSVICAREQWMKSTWCCRCCCCCQRYISTVRYTIAQPSEPACVDVSEWENKLLSKWNCQINAIVDLNDCKTRTSSNSTLNKYRIYRNHVRMCVKPKHYQREGESEKNKQINK